MKKRLRKNGNTSLFHTRADINIIMDFCNMLAEENESMKREIEKLKKRVND